MVCTFSVFTRVRVAITWYSHDKILLNKYGCLVYIITEKKAIENIHSPVNLQQILKWVMTMLFGLFHYRLA